MDSEDKKQESTISEKTKVVLAIPQLIAVIIFILAVSGGFVEVGSTAANAKTQAEEAKTLTKENKAEIEKMKIEAHNREVEYLNSLKNIELSLEQIKAAVNSKADRKYVE